MSPGAPATRRGFTTSAATESTPNASNSLSPYGSNAEHAFIFSTCANDTRFTTNSPVASIFRTVSFFDPSRRFTGTNINVGGADVTPWKKLNGARFAFPSADSVDTHAIGRGKIVLVIQ